MPVGVPCRRSRFVRDPDAKRPRQGGMGGVVGAPRRPPPPCPALAGGSVQTAVGYWRGAPATRTSGADQKGRGSLRPGCSRSMMGSAVVRNAGPAHAQRCRLRPADVIIGSRSAGVLRQSKRPRCGGDPFPTANLLTWILAVVGVETSGSSSKPTSGRTSRSRDGRLGAPPVIDRPWTPLSRQSASKVNHVGVTPIP